MLMLDKEKVKFKTFILRKLLIFELFRNFLCGNCVISHSLCCAGFSSFLKRRSAELPRFSRVPSCGIMSIKRMRQNPAGAGGSIPFGPLPRYQETSCQNTREGCRMEKQADAKRDLWTMLEEYGRSDYYPMHMPGHKRRGDAVCGGFPLELRHHRDRRLRRPPRPAGDSAGDRTARGKSLGQRTIPASGQRQHLAGFWPRSVRLSGRVTRC